MPTVTESTPRDSITIAKQAFTIPQPYSEGHVLSANEAAALNQVYAENLRNNFAAQVKAAEEAGAFDLATFQAKLDEYAATYEFGVRRGGGGRVSDPVENEALEIAKEKVRDAISKKGGKLSDYKAAAITEKAKEVLAKYPQIRETARAIVAARSETTDELDLGDMPSAEASSADAPKKSKKASAVDATPAAE